jgi:hypothetical protein
MKRLFNPDRTEMFILGSNRHSRIPQCASALKPLKPRPKPGAGDPQMIYRCASGEGDAALPRKINSG